ncbi:hypothetical protein, partial [Peribacillus simplex]|uniref:hypothetical protein n=1 Tax=Peribacillus simplex TaxID=1478 RepID=UPI0021AA6679
RRSVCTFLRPLSQTDRAVFPQSAFLHVTLWVQFVGSNPGLTTKGSPVCTWSRGWIQVTSSTLCFATV